LREVAYCLKTDSRAHQHNTPQSQPISDSAHRRGMYIQLTPLNLTIPQAAALLACSRSHLYDLLLDGSLPYVQLGGLRSHRRIRLVDLHKYNDDRLIDRSGVAA
jgi:excisionase family DNA binding protein